MKKILIGGCRSMTFNYLTAFSLLGAEAVPLEAVPESSVSPSLPFDGLVLPGGGDLSPRLFHQENAGSRNIDENLDRMQLSLFRAFAEAGKPVLGICKGMQLINLAFGGTLIQDLPPDSLALHTAPEKDLIHMTKAARNTFPFLLYGSRPVVNSAHHQALGRIGDDLLVAQYAPDFVVEAIWHRKLPILGVQWHPERLCFSHARKDAEDGSLLLRYFLSL